MATIAEENIIIDFQVRTDGLQVASKSVAALNTDAAKLEKTIAVTGQTIQKSFSKATIGDVAAAIATGTGNAKNFLAALSKLKDLNINGVAADFDEVSNEMVQLLSDVKLTDAQMELLMEDTEGVARALASIESGDLQKTAQKAEVLTKEFTSAKQELRELTSAINSGKLKGDELDIAKRRAGELKDNIGDVGDEIRRLASDTPALDNIGDAMQLGAAGFQIAEGAAALFGDESEELQKSLLKLNAVMALSNGISDIGRQLTEKGTLANKAATIAQAAYATVVGTSTGALKLFRLALAATGIGLLVILLGTLAANWDRVKKSIDENAQSFFDFGKKVTFILPPLNLLVKGIEYLYNNFDKLDDIASGVIDGIVAGLGGIGDVIGKLFDGDFSGAYAAAKEIGNKVGAAYNQGYKEAVKDDIDSARAKEIDSIVANQKKKIEVLNAEGKETAALQEKILKNELQALKLARADKEKIEEKQQELDVFYAEQRKKRAEDRKKAEAKAAEDRKKTIEKEVEETERLFVLRENQAKREIKDAEELADTLKRLELEKGIAVAQVRIKYTTKDSLDEAELQGVLLDLQRQLSDLAVGDRLLVEIPILPTIKTPEKLEIPKEGIERIKQIRENVLKGLLSGSEAEQLIDDEVSKMQRSIEGALQKVEIGNKESILNALNTGGNVDTAKDQAEINELQARIKGISDEMRFLLESGTGTAQEYNNLAISLLDAEIELKEKSIDLDKERTEAQKQAALELISNAKAVTDAVLTEAIRRKDGEIKIQQERLNALLGNIDKGNTEQVQLEEERLKKLTEEREKYAQAQRRIAAIEIAINTALAASQAITAITAAFKEGNIFKGIATSLALAAQVAATIISVRNAFSNLPSYRQGTERTGKGNVDGYGGFNAVLHPDERVLTAEQNAPLLKYGIKNTDVPKLALLGLGMKKYGSQTATMDMSKMEKIMKEQNTKLDRITEVLQNTGMDVSISDDGILNMTNRAKDRMDKAKRMRR